MSTERYDSIDVLRGAAIVWMSVFHFCFDLNYFHWIRQNFYEDPFWTWQRTAIVSLFLFCAGLGQAVAVWRGQSWSRFWKRWAQIAGCAALVSLGSYLMYPKSFIYFGVLHGIAVMLVIVRVTAPWGRWLWLAAALAIAAKPAAAWVMSQAPALEFLNERAWNWLGFITRKPITEDYVPLIPWLGVMWLGMAAGQWLLASQRHLISRAMPRTSTPLSWMGRWSLTWYMVHQPVMIGVLEGISALA